MSAYDPKQTLAYLSKSSFWVFNVRVVVLGEVTAMLRTIAIGLLLACLALWPGNASAQGGAWESYMAAGTKDYRQGHYTEAVKQFKAHWSACHFE